MATFDYEGLSQTGNLVSGEAEAESIYLLTQELRTAGIFLHTVAPRDRETRPHKMDRPLGVEELNCFTEQLAGLTRSGMPLAPALAELAREVRGRRLRRVLEEVRHTVESGRTLEEAFERQGKAIPALYRNLIRVGERTGNLPGVLQQLAEYGERHIWLRQRTLLAVAYPVFLVVALLLFMGLFVTRVISQFESIYDSFGGTLPAFTGAVLVCGQWIEAVVYPALALVATLALFSWFFGGRASFGSLGRRYWEALLLRFPGVGGAYQAILSARFFRALGMMLENGAPIVEALHLAGMATGSTRFASASVRAATRVAQGEPVSEALGDTGMLRRLELWMLKQGESQGDFPTALIRLADLCDRDASNRQLVTLSTLGPALVTLFGILIGIVVVACFLPIFQISSALN